MISEKGPLFTNEPNCMNELEFIFCHSKKLFARLIEQHTYGSFSHVAVKFKDLIVEASFLHGVRETTISQLCNANTFVVWKSIEINKCDKEINEVLRSQIGRPYDYFALLGAMFRENDWQDTSSWYCSELGAYCADKLGFNLFFADERIVTPQMLYVALTPYIIKNHGVLISNGH